MLNSSRSLWRPILTFFHKRIGLGRRSLAGGNKKEIICPKAASNTEDKMPLWVIRPKAGEYFDLTEEGVSFRIGDKSLHLYRHEVIEILLRKFDELPDEGRKVDPSKPSPYKYQLYGVGDYRVDPGTKLPFT